MTISQLKYKKKIAVFVNGSFKYFLAVVNDNYFILVLLRVFDYPKNKSFEFVLFGTTSSNKRI